MYVRMYVQLLQWKYTRTYVTRPVKVNYVDTKSCFLNMFSYKPYVLQDFQLHM